MQDSVTGNTSGFELEIEGSNPSPAANIAKRYFDCCSTKNDVEQRTVVFIRFVSGEINEYSHVSAGLFCAVFKLRSEESLPEHELEALRDLARWFNIYLESPFDYLADAPRLERAICWFKPDASEHLARAWEMIGILERNNVFIRMIKSRKVGYILYEDEAQVFAEPFADTRLIL
jgi:hypothetical protein